MTETRTDYLVGTDLQRDLHAALLHLHQAIRELDACQERLKPWALQYDEHRDVYNVFHAMPGAALRHSRGMLIAAMREAET